MDLSYGKGPICQVKSPGCGIYSLEADFDINYPTDFGISPPRISMHSTLVFDPLKNVSPNTVSLIPISTNILNKSPKGRNLSLLSHHGHSISPSAAFCSFGELADASKLGELPCEDDLFMKYLDPICTSTTVCPSDNNNNAVASSGDVLNACMTGSNCAPFGLSVRQWSEIPPLITPNANFSSHMLIPIPDSHLNNSGIVGEDTAENWSQGARKKVRAAVHRKRRSPSFDSRDENDDSDFEEKFLVKKKVKKSGVQAQKDQIGTHQTATTSLFSGTPVVAQIYRGVSHHRLTQRWEASLWLQGRQLYLGGFETQEEAARAYDLAALACKGSDAVINFTASDYEHQLEEVAGFSREEVVAYVRRRSAAFSRGKSKYRGVSGHNGRWEARIGSFGGRKNVSFGIFDTEEQAARQYDRALILEKGRSAKTNFPLRDYIAEVQDFKRHIASTSASGDARCAARMREMAAYTLPVGRTATAEDKKRSIVIYGEALRQALEKTS